MKARVFNIMQYETNPATGDSLNFTEQNILDGLNHKSIKRYAYIAHDKDVYTEEGVAYAKEHYGIDVAEGDQRPKHWHIVLDCPNQIEIYTIAKWFGIPEFCIDVPKGRGAFLDCVAYLTHADEKQQELGKVLYPDDEVKADFDWKDELDKRAERQLRYGRDLSPKDFYRAEVLNGRMTLRQLRAKDELAYINDSSKLDEFRRKAINEMEPPKSRYNYYLTGHSGVGKSLTARALARSLYQLIYDCAECPRDDDVYFSVGNSKKTLLEGYDGQPIIIWHDRRASTLIGELGSPEAFFNVMDTHPDRGRMQIKYDSINLLNRINIIEGIEPFEDFIDTLSKHEDPTQSRRRVPFIVNLHDTDFDFLINKGFADMTDNFFEYYEYRGFVGNMGAVRQRLRGIAEEHVRKVESRVIQPIVDKSKELDKKFNTPLGKLEDLLSEFEDYGKQDTEKIMREIIELEVELENVLLEYDWCLGNIEQIYDIFAERWGYDADAVADISVPDAGLEPLIGVGVSWPPKNWVSDPKNWVSDIYKKAEHLSLPDCKVHFKKKLTALEGYLQDLETQMDDIQRRLDDIKVYEP